MGILRASVVPELGIRERLCSAAPDVVLLAVDLAGTPAGRFLLLLKRAEARGLCDLFLRESEGDRELDTLDRSILERLLEVMANNYGRILRRTLGTPASLSVPYWISPPGGTHQPAPDSYTGPDYLLQVVHELRLDGQPSGCTGHLILEPGSAPLGERLAELA